MTMRKLQVAAAASALFGLASGANSVNVGVDSASPHRNVDYSAAEGLTIVGNIHQVGAQIQDSDVIRSLPLKKIDDAPARRGCVTGQVNTLDLRKTGNKVRRPRTNRVSVGVCVTTQGLGKQSLHRDAAGFHDTALATH